MTDKSEEELQDFEFLKSENLEEPEKDSIQTDDDQMDLLMMLQEMDDDKHPMKYDSIEEKYEEELLLDHVEKMVSKYMEQESSKRP